MPSAPLPAGIVVFTIAVGLVFVGMGWYLLSVSRERLWIHIQKRNAAMGVASPPALPESAVRNYRLGGVVALVAGIVIILLPLVFPLFWRMSYESSLRSLMK